jgi:predicted transposase/invertase (TIGR01784 family)
MIPVVPYLFYHTDSGYKIACFSDLFNLSEDEKTVLLKYIPDFCPETFFLNQTDLSEIKFSLHLYAFLSTIRFADANQIIDHWDEILHSAASVFQGEKGLEELMKLVLYVINRTDAPVDAIKAPVLRINRNAEEFMVTTAERIRQEGKLEGKLEGAHEKALMTARAMLLKGFSVIDIAELTGLPLEDIKKLK